MKQVKGSSELVLGLITTVGTNTQRLIECLQDQFKFFGFTAEVINVSKDILNQFLTTPEPKTEYDRIVTYMDLGDAVRKEANDNAILMRGAAGQIYSKREKIKGGPQPRENIVYIIKSIKHPDEVTCLREIYGDGFYAVGVTSTKEERIHHLYAGKGLTEEQAKELITRDEEDDSSKFGQHTRDAFQRADYFLSITDSQVEMQNNVIRLVYLLFGNPYLTPTFDEYAMFMAYAASLRSADLSRQIGAVVTKDNEIIASGVNDCAKPGGGLYWPEKNEKGEYNDISGGRDYTLKADSNKIEQARLINRIIEEFKKEFRLCSGTDEEAIEDVKNQIRNRLKKTGIGALTEYGRVVHAEMEALSMCARNMISSKGTTMYVTTFPCHNCAKHIIAAGVEKVYYIEPYPKSKALEFYQGQITTVDTDTNTNTNKKVKFLPFSGVGPRRFIDLFSMDSHRWQKRQRKNDEGETLKWDKSKANLRTPMPTMIYLEKENSAYSNFYEGTKTVRKGASKNDEH